MRLEIALAEVLPIGTHVYVTAASVAGQPARQCRNLRACRTARDSQPGSRVHKHCLGKTPGVCARPARSYLPVSKAFRPSVVRSFFIVRGKPNADDAPMRFKSPALELDILSATRRRTRIRRSCQTPFLALADGLCDVRSPATNPASLGGMTRPSREMFAFGLVQRAQELL
jgi:hypothetical protein